MSTTSLEHVAAFRVPWSVRAAALVEMSKPRISALVLFTVAIGALVGSRFSPTPLDGWRLIHTLVGTGLVAISTAALNQWLERRIDARMPRTAGRPLPTGRLSVAEVVAFGAGTAIVGTAWLAAAVNPTTAGLGLLTWALYVWVYTPLKPRTTLNTMVGAVGGALPILMGWTASGAEIRLPALTLFMILYLWQFPHFMAIAWLYRADYALGGLRMLTVIDPSGRLAGRQALASSLALLAVSLLPSVQIFGQSPEAPLYAAWALVLGLAYVAASGWFLLRRDDASARRLLQLSLVYLPALLAALWFTLGGESLGPPAW